MERNSLRSESREYYDNRNFYQVISSGSEKDILRTSKLLNDVGSFLTTLLQTFRNSKIEVKPKKNILRKVISTLSATAKQIDVILNFIYDKDALREGRRLSYDMKRISDELSYYNDMKDSEFQENQENLREVIGLFGETNFRSSEFGDTIRHLIQKNKMKHHTSRY